MEKSWIIKDIAKSSASDTVIIIIKNRRQRRQIVEQFGKLGDRVVDYYSQTQLYAVSDFWGIPHRLMVMSYRDYYINKKSIAKYLTDNGTFDFPPILVFGRLWRKLPKHPAMIDGDGTSPEALYRMYWEARGESFDVFRREPICF